MLDRTYIKPIPKHILALIKREDKKGYKTPCGNHRCYSYLATWKKELVKITVAVKHYKERWYCNKHNFRHSKRNIIYFTYDNAIIFL